MAIETTCSGCGQRLAVADEHAGMRARCPSCGQIYTIPQVIQAAPNVATDHQAALAETTAGNPSEAGGSADPVEPTSEASDERIWMQTADGNQYGPVDRVTLNRWFNEGRVGPGYQIRQGELGAWQPAESFRPSSHPGAGDNPYAATANQATSTAPSLGRYPKQDSSGLVLTMGILAWVFFVLCMPMFSWIPGLIAWITGRSALQDIQAGVADPSNASMVKVGYYLGMSQVLVVILAVIAAFGFFGFAIVVDSL